MSISAIWKTVINSGVAPGQTYTFSDKLVSRNKLSFLCIIFSLIYVVYFAINQLYFPLFGISFGIVLFGISILLNKAGYFNLSSLLILLNTNYCVLFFSIYLGFGSGIHLYLYTSPLIVLTLFDKKSIPVIALAMSSYAVNFCVISFIDKYYHFSGINLPQRSLEIFYIINFCCSIFILATLSLYFLINNNRINQLLVQKNEELSVQQELLWLENTTRKAAEEKAKESLAQREVLLSEIHHRVKNNLAVINGLMELQSVYIKDKNTLGVIKESQNRIKSLAILHEKLYENKTLKEVEMGSYVDQLIQFVKISLSSKEKAIQINSRIESINLEMAKAMPFALLLNELISNSLKHAFNALPHGEIQINFSRNETGYILNYVDNGPGFDYESNRERNSLGLNLVETFSEQLRGNFEFSKEKPGTKFTLFFS